MKATGNLTGEYLLPVSYGLAEHLHKFKGDSLRVYFWLHFNKVVKGEKVGLVMFNCQEIAFALKLSKSVVKTSLDHLVKIKMIQYVRKSKSRWSDSVARIAKNKTMADFMVLNKNGKILPLSIQNGKSNGKSRKSLKANKLHAPKDDKGCTSKEVALRTINDPQSSWLVRCNARLQILTGDYEFSGHSSLNLWKKEFSEELIESVLIKLQLRGKKLGDGWFAYILKVLREEAPKFRPLIDTVEKDPEYQKWLEEQEA